VPVSTILVFADEQYPDGYHQGYEIGYARGYEAGLAADPPPTRRKDSFSSGM
jgi:hypothetical protein